ncbi:MAG: sulfotransferase, partial [Opitutales bacterium]
MARYLKWWLRALRPGANPSAPLTWRRILFLLLAPLLLAVQVFHWLGLFLDELLFPNYRKVKIEAPVFITGIPRSGTTFVHRTLAHDSMQFTTVS